MTCQAGLLVVAPRGNQVAWVPKVTAFSSSPLCCSIEQILVESPQHLCIGVPNTQQCATPWTLIPPYTSVMNANKDKLVRAK